MQQDHKQDEELCEGTKDSTGMEREYIEDYHTVIHPKLSRGVT